MRTYMQQTNAGRGRQVIAVCKSADLLLMVLDASKPHAHRKILTAELEAVGIRLNRRPPSIYFKKKKTGGISFNSTIPLTRMDEKLCFRILESRGHSSRQHRHLLVSGLPAFLVSVSATTMLPALATLPVRKCTERSLGRHSWGDWIQRQQVSWNAM